MTKNTSTHLSTWRLFVKKLKKGAKIIKKGLRDFSLTYPNVSQIIQLTFIYFFAMVDLLHSILNNVFSLGYMPEILLPVFPLIQKILQDPILRLWASPEKVFVLSYVALEVVVVSTAFKFSKLVKYNVLLIFSMLMVQGLMVSYWDALFHRAVATPVVRWAYDQGALTFIDKPVAIFFFLSTFFIFLFTYIYLYFKAINNQFATLYRMEWLTDSVAFWLKIRTPTMRFGKRKKDKDKRKPK